MTNLAPNALRRTVDTVREHERYGRRLISQTLPQRRGPRTQGLVRNAIVTSTITARQGLVKGSGMVSILCDDGTGTGTDYVLATNVRVWNPYREAIAPNSLDRIVTIEVVDGLLQVRGADCP